MKKRRIHKEDKIKMSKEERIKKLFFLSSVKVYNYKKGFFDLDEAIDATRDIEKMAFKNEELSVVRECDGASVLHIAIYSCNAPLIAYYVDMGVDKDKKSATGVTPKDLIKKLGDIYEDLEDAFNNAEDYLINNKVLEDFDSYGDASDEVSIIGEDF